MQNNIVDFFKKSYAGSVLVSFLEKQDENEPLKQFSSMLSVIFKEKIKLKNNDEVFHFLKEKAFLEKPIPLTYEASLILKNNKREFFTDLIGRIDHFSSVESDCNKYPNKLGLFFKVITSALPLSFWKEYQNYYIMKIEKINSTYNYNMNIAFFNNLQKVYDPELKEINFSVFLLKKSNLCYVLSMLNALNRSAEIKTKPVYFLKGVFELLKPHHQCLVSVLMDYGDTKYFEEKLLDVLDRDLIVSYGMKTVEIFSNHSNIKNKNLTI